MPLKEFSWIINYRTEEEKMKFEEALMCVELVIESDAVPLLIGESGIGKTSLIRKLGKKMTFI